jgi:hypothetical protein
MVVLAGHICGPGTRDSFEPLGLFFPFGVVCAYMASVTMLISAKVCFKRRMSLSA